MYSAFTSTVIGAVQLECFKQAHNSAPGSYVQPVHRLKSALEGQPILSVVPERASGLTKLNVLLFNNNQKG